MSHESFSLGCCLNSNEGTCALSHLTYKEDSVQMCRSKWRLISDHYWSVKDKASIVLDPLCGYFLKLLGLISLSDFFPLSLYRTENTYPAWEKCWFSLFNSFKAANEHFNRHHRQKKFEKKKNSIHFLSNILKSPVSANSRQNTLKQIH